MNILAKQLWDFLVEKKKLPWYVIPAVDHILFVYRRKSFDHEDEQIMIQSNWMCYSKTGDPSISIRSSNIEEFVSLVEEYLPTVEPLCDTWLDVIGIDPQITILIDACTVNKQLSVNQTGADLYSALCSHGISCDQKKLEQMIFWAVQWILLTQEEAGGKKRLTHKENAIVKEKAILAHNHSRKKNDNNSLWVYLCVQAFSSFMEKDFGVAIGCVQRILFVLVERLSIIKQKSITETVHDLIS
jgi:hypothetical protein